MSDLQELDLLKQRAEKMGIQFHPSIGLDKLKEKIQNKLDGVQSADEVVPEETEGETLQQRRMRLTREASKLIRIQVTCMNPGKKEWPGEIFTCGNKYVGTHRKFVPFDNEEGWHVPQIILNMIQARKCQIFKTVKGPNGEKMKKSVLIKEFNVVILPPLTQEELDELAAAQKAGHNLQD